MNTVETIRNERPSTKVFQSVEKEETFFARVHGFLWVLSIVVIVSVDSSNDN